MRVQTNTRNYEKTLIYPPPLLVAAAIFALGCAKESIPPPAEAPAPQQEEQTAGDVWQTAAYQESTGDWLTPSQDPYDLTMVQQAYNNLTKGRAVIPHRESLDVTFEGGLRGLQAGLLPEVAKEFEQPSRKGFKLKPTHRVLKTWPRTPEQAEALEADERLDVRTYPTNYTPISAKEARELSKTRMASAKKLPKETKYTYTDPGGESTAGLVPPSEVELPVFYIVWPTDVAVPGDLDHEKLYDVFLPEKGALNLSDAALQALDFETNALARRAEQGLELTAQAAYSDHPFEIGQQIGGQTLSSHGAMSSWSGDAVGDKKALVTFEGVLANGRPWKGGIYYHAPGYNPNAFKLNIYFDQSSPEVSAASLWGRIVFPKGDIRVTSLAGNLKIPMHWEAQETTPTPPRGSGGARWDTGFLPDDDDSNDEVFIDGSTTLRDIPIAPRLSVSGYVLYTLKKEGSPLGQDVPLAHIQVNFEKGGRTFQRIYTDANGYFSTSAPAIGGVGRTPPLIPSDATMYLRFQDEDGDFQLSPDNYFVCVQIHQLGSVSDNYYDNKFIMHPSNDTAPYFESWIAADYYWHGDHPIPVGRNATTPFLIQVSNVYDSSYFVWSRAYTERHIEMHKRDPDDSIECISAAFHELGHWSQWRMHGADFQRWRVYLHDIMCESWAEYVGWELGERYCSEHGWGRDLHESSNKTRCNDQSWVTSIADRAYSPLFIDMVDDYNQRSSSFPGGPYDIIYLSDPYPWLNRIATEKGNSAGFREIMEKYYELHWPGDKEKKKELGSYFVAGF